MTIERCPPAEAVEAADDASVISGSLVEPTVFEVLYRRHHDVIYRYVASRIGVAAVDDVVGEVFLSAFASRASFDASRSGSAIPWLLGIATRRIIRERRAQRRWNKLLSVAHLESTDDEDDAAVQRIDASKLAPQIVAGIATLRAADREPLLLHVLAGLTYEEISTALDLPVGTVRSRVSRARQRLAGILDGAAR